MESHKEDQVSAPSKSKVDYSNNRKRRHNIGVPPDVHELLTKIAKRHKRTLIGQIAYWCDRETII